MQIYSVNHMQTPWIKDASFICVCSCSLCSLLPVKLARSFIRHGTRRCWTDVCDPRKSFSNYYQLLESILTREQMNWNNVTLLRKEMKQVICTLKCFIIRVFLFLLKSVHFWCDFNNYCNDFQAIRLQTLLTKQFSKHYAIVDERLT